MYAVVERDKVTPDRFRSIYLDDVTTYDTFEEAADTLIDNDYEGYVVIEIKIRAELVATRNVELRELP
jgi:hypothetical protein